MTFMQQAKPAAKGYELKRRKINVCKAVLKQKAASSSNPALKWLCAFFDALPADFDLPLVLDACS